MAYEIPGFSFTLVAAADLRTSQFCAVDMANASGIAQAVLPLTEGGRCIGVLQNHPNLGETGTIFVTGVSKCKAGVGGIVAGDSLTVDADGTFITATTGERVVGVCYASAAVGELGSVLLLNAGGTIAES